MGTETGKINRSLMIGWTSIVAILVVTYLIEVVKGTRDISYILVFDAVTIIPWLLCALLYFCKKDSERLRYYIVVGYFFMYVFSLFTGSTYMVSCYVLPLLSMLILYHQPGLVVRTGVGASVANAASILYKLFSGELTTENSKNAEIQIALILLCFIFCYAATKIYDNIHRQNIEFLKKIEEKNQQHRLMTMQTIMTIINTIDAKDEYTKGHSQRVSEYSAVLAKEIGYDEENVERVRYIALLHDIGKIGVPDAILNKPGRLSNTEFALMRMHTVVGGDILKDIQSMEGLDVGAKYHHERYDGAGYPEGLRGEEIPEVARIICIADAYDAMTSHRVYRKRMSDEAVQEEIVKCAGTQFDPEMAKAFLNILKRGDLKEAVPDKFLAQDGTDDEVGEEVLSKLLGDAGAYKVAEQKQDGLTGVYSRAYGEELLNNYFKDDGFGSLLLIDLDALRNINSMFGFLKGDLYLNTVAKLIQRDFSNSIVYRSGGDEFVCMLCGFTDIGALKKELDKFYADLESMRQTDDELDSLSVSIGVFIVKLGEFDKDDVLNRAERALYFAKQKGHTDYCIYQELGSNFQPNLSRDDLNNLLRTIHKQGGYSKAYEIHYPEFAKMLNYLERIAERNKEEMQVIMFTLLALDEESITIDEKLNAMKILESAVNSSLRKVDVTLQFSSSQRILLLPGLDKQNIDLVIQRIISAFYKRCDDKKFTLSYECADMSENDFDSEEA